MKRAIVLAAGLAVLIGCDDDDDGPGTPLGSFGRHPAGTADPGPAVEFFDDFSGSFPAPNWEIRRGSPFIAPAFGNPQPALALRPFGDRIRVRSAFAFSGSEALTLSFDLATYDLQNSSKFRVRLRGGEGETSLEADIDDGEFEFRISGSRDDDDFPFDESPEFMPIRFTVDANGSAAWWVDGVSFMAGTFAPGTYRIEFEASGGDRTKFVVDNVKITRP